MVMADHHQNFFHFAFAKTNKAKQSEDQMWKIKGKLIRNASLKNNNMFHFFVKRNN